MSSSWSPLQIVHPADLSRCRRSLGFTRIAFDAGESQGVLVDHVRGWIEKYLDMPRERVLSLGPIEASRPLTKYQDRSKDAVEVIFALARVRDIVISLMRKLAGAQDSAGRMFAIYPEAWKHLKESQEAKARELRDFRVSGRQIWQAQIRYSDDANGICVFVRNKAREDPWMKLEAARKKYDADQFPHGGLGGLPVHVQAPADQVRQETSVQGQPPAADPPVVLTSANTSSPAAQAPPLSTPSTSSA